MLRFGLFALLRTVHISHIKVTVTCNKDANLGGTTCEHFALPKDPLGACMHQAATLQYEKLVGLCFQRNLLVAFCFASVGLFNLDQFADVSTHHWRVCYCSNQGDNARAPAMVWRNEGHLGILSCHLLSSLHKDSKSSHDLFAVSFLCLS